MNFFDKNQQPRQKLGMIKFLTLLLLSSTIVLAGPRDEAGDILLRFKAETSVSKRLELISRLFLGLPYGKNGPLGEGLNGKYDQDPLYRFDTFDCTTYVETIMALAIARSTDEFEEHLDKIRYKDGEVDYLTRNHFTDLQWIPFNIQNGYMAEINQAVVSGPEIQTAEALINFPNWIRSIKVDQIIVPGANQSEKLRLLDELHAEASNYQVAKAKVPYLAINDLVLRPALLDKIPNGTVVNFVRPNWDLTQLIGTRQNISHQGFLFRIGKILYLRHASTSGRVEEVPFLNYLKNFVNHATLKGIHLMQVNGL